MDDREQIDKMRAEHFGVKVEEEVKGLYPRLQNQDKATADFLRLVHDYRSTAFGPDYFNGAKWGAFSSFWLVVYCGRRSYKQLMLKAAAQRKAGTFHGYMAADGMQCVTLFACAVMSVLKFSKWFVARGRHNEFLWDEYYAKKSASLEDRAELQYMEMQRAKAKEREEKTPSRHLKNLRARDSIPTWWDGFAVGVMGSLQDAYNPQKPVIKYLGMKFGKGFSMTA